jgi:hypothetical protein
VFGAVEVRRGWTHRLPVRLSGNRLKSFYQLNQTGRISIARLYAPLMESVVVVGENKVARYRTSLLTR